jgi:hypothetical protein
MVTCVPSANEKGPPHSQMVTGGPSQLLTTTRHQAAPTSLPTGDKPRRSLAFKLAIIF